MMPLTDNQLSNVFVQLYTDYKAIIKYTTNRDEVAAGLQSFVRALFEENKGVLSEYAQDEKEQARLYKAVDLLVSLLPPSDDDKAQGNRQDPKPQSVQYQPSAMRSAFQDTSVSATQMQTRPRNRRGNNIMINNIECNQYINQRVVNHYYQSSASDNALFWFTMGSNFNNRHSFLHSLYCCDIFSRSCCSGGRHLSNSSSNDDSGNALAKLIVLMVLVAACCGAIYSAYYLFQQVTESISRIWNDEGYLQGFFPLLSAVIGGILGNLVATKLLGSTFTALALSAGWSPAIVLGVLAVSLACILATVFAVGTKLLVEKIIEDKTAIDPYDPCTYTLTDENRAKIRSAGLDEDLVLFTMAGLRQEMGENNQNKAGRFFSPPKQLEMIRNMRDGKGDRLKLGGQDVSVRKKPAPGVWQPPVYLSDVEVQQQRAAADAAVFEP